jgi:hypothetical protein
MRDAPGSTLLWPMAEFAEVERPQLVVAEEHRDVIHHRCRAAIGHRLEGGDGHRAAIFQHDPYVLRVLRHSIPVAHVPKDEDVADRLPEEIVPARIRAPRPPVGPVVEPETRNGHPELDELAAQEKEN